MLEDPPKGFAKATGVIEKRRRCTKCNQIFPVTSDMQEPCPHCKSMATVMIRTGQQFPRLAQP